MRYFFLIYGIIALLVVLALPNRFGTFSETEIRVFPDMDEQDVPHAQGSSNFFADGRVARTPDKNLVTMGFRPLTKETASVLPHFGFTNGEGYVFTGKNGDEFGSGIPVEFGLDSIEDVREFLAHGKERYEINCTACHGLSANGNGVVKSRANVFSGIPSLTETLLSDGGVYHVITNGRGMMGAFKHNTSVRDRWAIVAYIRSLKQAKEELAAASK